MKRLRYFLLTALFVAPGGAAYAATSPKSTSPVVQPLQPQPPSPQPQSSNQTTQTPSTTTSLGPCDYNSWIEQGEQLAKSGDCKKAIGAYGQAIRCKPADPWAFYFRSMVRQGLGQKALSKKDLSVATKFAAKNPQFQNRKKPDNGAAETFQSVFGDSAQCIK